MTTELQLEVSADLIDLHELFSLHFVSLALLSMVADERTTVGDLVTMAESGGMVLGVSLYDSRRAGVLPQAPPSPNGHRDPLNQPAGLVGPATARTEPKTEQD